MNVIKELLSIYNLEDNVSHLNQIDLLKLPSQYQIALSCLFYPKTLLSPLDMKYVNDFWSRYTQEWEAYCHLQQELIKKHKNVDKGIIYSYDVKVSIAHFCDIPNNIVGVTEAKGGFLKLKEILIPESFIINREIVSISISNGVPLLEKFYSTPNIVFSLDSVVSNTSSPILLILCGTQMNLNHKYLQGYRIGMYCLNHKKLLLHIGYDNLIFIKWGDVIEEIHLTTNDVLKYHKYFIPIVADMNDEQPLWNVLYGATTDLIDKNEYTMVNQITKLWSNDLNLLEL